jgi:hypothetical protein
MTIFYDNPKQRLLNLMGFFRLERLELFFCECEGETAEDKDRECFRGWAEKLILELI